LDAIFSPTRRVNFTIEPIHVGQETSREQLHLEVWTDGTISATEAVSSSASILTQQLSPFIDYAKVSQVEEEQEAIRLSIPDEQYNMSVEQLDLSVRTMNCLRGGDIITVGQLISTGEKKLMSLRNFGQKSKREVEERLASMGLSLTPSVEDLTSPQVGEDADNGQPED
jgi:DNA-directed RNA polymerase subunit alpha